jgi:hypothetical protein
MWERIKTWAASEKPVKRALLGLWELVTERVRQEIDDRVDFDREQGPGDFR